MNGVATWVSVSSPVGDSPAISFVRMRNAKLVQLGVLFNLIR